jgi:hypothetical protein
MPYDLNKEGTGLVPPFPSIGGAFVTISLIVGLVITLNHYVDKYVTERSLREVTGAQYAKLNDWYITPIRPTGKDLTTIRPSIKEAMDNGHVSFGEWYSIQDAIARLPWRAPDQSMANKEKLRRSIDR